MTPEKSKPITFGGPQPDIRSSDHSEGVKRSQSARLFAAYEAGGNSCFAGTPISRRLGMRPSELFSVHLDQFKTLEEPIAITAA